MNAAARQHGRPTYPAYKPSGVEWLGDVPQHWEVLAFKRLGAFQAGAGFPNDEQGLEDDELPFYKVSDTNLPGNEVFMNVHNNAVSRDTAMKLRAYVFPQDTIVFAKVGAALLLNKRRILTRPSCIDNNMMGFIRRSCDRNWAYYWMRSLDLGELANPGAVPSVNEGQIREIRVPVPPLEEQRAIAGFLDRETERIDALIEKKQRQIELLQEKRSALISRAVTKGLDPNAPTKPSGIPWLGDIPQHWGTSPFKHHFRYQKGRMAADLSKEYIGSNPGDYPVYSGQTENGGLMGSIDTYEFDVLSPVILVTTVGAKAMTTRLVSGRFSLSQNCAILCPRPRSSADATYYNGVLLPLFRHERRLISLIMQPSLRFEDLDRFKVPTPPPEEQRDIAAFLDRETERIDALGQKIEGSVEKLREYRTALISAAVTGKIDVREEARP